MAKLKNTKSIGNRETPEEPEPAKDPKAEKVEKLLAKFDEIINAANNY